MRVAPAFLTSLALLVSGCCGGYAVVRTVAHEGAALRDDRVVAGEGAVLHYSRLGEPPNTCGGDARYTENLWVQVPSLQPGATYVVGSPGVVVAYARTERGQTLAARGVTGKLTIEARDARRVVVDVDVAITLASGEVVKLDDDYDFHPQR